MPRGAFFHFECDCGFAGKISIHDNGAKLTLDEIRDRAEKAWVAHVPPRERRTYLLLDVRPPEDFKSMGDLRAELREAGYSQTAARIEAKRRFEAQLPIRGNFLMPEGRAIYLHTSEERDGMHYGMFSLEPDGPKQELPIGEVRTPDGRVWRAE